MTWQLKSKIIVEEMKSLAKNAEGCRNTVYAGCDTTNLRLCATAMRRPR